MTFGKAGIVFIIGRRSTVVRRRVLRSAENTFNAIRPEQKGR